MKIYTVYIQNFGKHTSGEPSRRVDVVASDIEVAMKKVQRSKKHCPKTAERITSVDLLVTVDIR